MPDFNQTRAVAIMRIMALSFKELEFINIWSVLFCQIQLLLLLIVLLFDLTHKLFLSTPQ